MVLTRGPHLSATGRRKRESDVGNAGPCAEEVSRWAARERERATRRCWAGQLGLVAKVKKEKRAAGEK